MFNQDNKTKTKIQRNVMHVQVFPQYFYVVFENLISQYQFNTSI